MFSLLLFFFFLLVVRLYIAVGRQLVLSFSLMMRRDRVCEAELDDIGGIVEKETKERLHGPDEPCYERPWS